MRKKDAPARKIKHQISLNSGSYDLPLKELVEFLNDLPAVVPDTARVSISTGWGFPSSVTVEWVSEDA